MSSMAKKIKINQEQQNLDVKIKADVSIFENSTMSFFKSTEVKKIHDESDFCVLYINDKIYHIDKEENNQIFFDKRRYSDRDAQIGAGGAFLVIILSFLNVIQAGSSLAKEVNFINLIAIFGIFVMSCLLYKAITYINIKHLHIVKELNHYKLPHNTLSTNEFIHNKPKIRNIGISHIQVVFISIFCVILGIGVSFSRYVGKFTTEEVSDTEDVILKAISIVSMILIFSALISKSISNKIHKEPYITDLSFTAEFLDKDTAIKEDRKVVDIGIAIQVPEADSFEQFEIKRKMIEKKYEGKVVVGIKPHSYYRDKNSASILNSLSYTKLISHIFKEKYELRKEEEKFLLTDHDLNFTLENNLSSILDVQNFIESKKMDEDEYKILCDRIGEERVKKMESLNQSKIIDILYSLLETGKRFGKSLTFLYSNLRLSEERTAQLLLENAKLQGLQSLVSASENAKEIEKKIKKSEGISNKMKAIIGAGTTVVGAILYYYFYYVQEPGF